MAGPLRRYSRCELSRSHDGRSDRASKTTNRRRHSHTRDLSRIGPGLFGTLARSMARAVHAISRPSTNTPSIPPCALHSAGRDFCVRHPFANAFMHSLNFEIADSRGGHLDSAANPLLSRGETSQKDYLPHGTLALTKRNDGLDGRRSRGNRGCHLPGKAN